MKEYAGRAAIGHVRYATCGRDDRSYAQPFERHHIKKHKWFSFAFNGQLANYAELREELLGDEDNYLARETDTEIIMHDHQRRRSRPTTAAAGGHAAARLAEKFDGAYSLVFLDALGDMVVARDPLGIKPLSYAIQGPLFAAASESVALLNLGFAPENIQSLPPGKAVIISEGQLKIRRFAPSPRQAHCFFEWIYFSNVASTIDGRSVYLARKALGEELARLETVPIDDDTIVVPVPDTSKAAADAMAYQLKVPCLEGLIRNRYSGRTFIEGGGDRKQKAQMKYTPLREVLEGKTGDPGRGLDRPLDDHESRCCDRIRWQGRAQGDPRSRGLPAHHLALLLRHRHVDLQRAVRPAFSQGQAAHRRDPGPNGRPAGGRFAPLSARGIGRPSRSARARPTLPGVHHRQLSHALRPEAGRSGLGRPLELRSTCVPTSESPWRSRRGEGVARP